MAYAAVSDVQARLTVPLTDAQLTVCSTLLDDAAIMIDAVAASASNNAKAMVSCTMVVRALASTGDMTVPVGATQGSMSALGYSQSWTIQKGSTGELYLSKAEKRLLGVGNRIGSHSPLEDMT